MGSQAQESDMSPKIAIIGAGLTGLLAAHGLKKNGFHNITVYDGDASPMSRPRDWTLVIHWAMPTFLGLLLPLPTNGVGSNEILTKAICNPYLNFQDDVTESLVAYNGISGDHLFSSLMKGSRRVSRQRLRGLLLEALSSHNSGIGGGDIVQWGKKLVGIETQGEAGLLTLVFADGSVITGVDYVLGADGPASKVRELLFKGQEEDAKLTGSGFMMSSCYPSYHDAEMFERLVQKHPVASVTMSLDTVMGFGVMDAPDPSDKSTWTAFWHKIWKGTAETLPVDRQGKEALNYLKETTKGLAGPFQALIDNTPEGSPCFIDELKTWITRSFSRSPLAGRVTLAGDSAHPMLVYRGQGYQHAITDVRKYVDALRGIVFGGEERVAVMAQFDADVVKRGSEAVVQSLKEAELSMSPETVSKMLMVRKGHGKLEVA
ncbi:hypothetical protein V8F20_004421 [Naviculisporaceae sp. PSN 640]